MNIDQLKPNKVLRGPIFPEPVQVIVVIPMGDAVKLVGKGVNTSRVYEPILTLDNLAALETTPDTQPFDGNAQRFRLGVEALRLSLAYEYDPYFSLSIARVDPLPHQLEAVYQYFMAMPRIRFLLADDPGAGKTVMAGLLLKELKVRGLVSRTLILTPASLSFQWQREMKDKFRENFEIIRSDVLRANYGSNPWQDKNQVITSVSWVSRIEDAKESLLRSHWDLIIVDEAHKMSAISRDKKTLAYQLGEALSQMTDHYLLMTATPHKGDPDNFCLFLELLDRDVYGDVKSLEEAMRKHEAPFYLRRVKEALVSFPDPQTGKVKALFTKRIVRTTEFQITLQELDFYDALTRFVEDQSIKAASENSARGRALGFTMAMLQRRFASSIYAVRCSLQRMKGNREQILADPEAYRQAQINKRLPDEFDDLPEDEQLEIVAELENLVASYDPAALREEIIELGKLIQLAQTLEKLEVESKLVRLKELIIQHGIFQDPKMKLLIFTEHKDTLDFLCGDGKEGRPLGKLREWGLTVTQIHGGMKIGDRDTLGSRIFAEREFRESAQVLVATEAAGEGINLQFCWLMINYDIPWNPVRLEQRMGRIHRYGQEKDCLIFNFVSTNTREGRVLQKLFERIQAIEEDLDPKRTGKVFNVLGDVFPSNQLEKMIRDMYAHNQMDEELIKQRIVEQVDTKRLESITNSTLEGLAKRELNLSALIGKSAEAKERRLVPEVIEDFFTEAAPIVGVNPREIREDGHVYRLGRLPRALWTIGERLEPRFGKLGREYPTIVFNKEYLKRDPTLEWVTPGHPLFEAVREDVTERVREDLLRGSVFYDLHSEHPYRLDVFAASIKDGRGNQLHRRIFVVQAEQTGQLSIRQPTIFSDLALAPKEKSVPDGNAMPDQTAAERFLIADALSPFLAEVSAQRARETSTIARHLEISLKELIHRQNMRMAELYEQGQGGDETLLAANTKRVEDKLDDLNGRLERRRAELLREAECMIGDVQHIGRAWVLPHPERASPQIAPMVRDEEVERIAVQHVIAHEEARGWKVESVEKDNRGFDLISRKPHPEDPETAIEVRFIEVKGRAGVGEIALTSNEFKTAERLKKDYWLYVVFECASALDLHIVSNPATMDWKPVVRVEHFFVEPTAVFDAEKLQT
jgi:superfamily II DNA or RNA helicase